jgi:MoxR-like ATPase
MSTEASQSPLAENLKDVSGESDQQLIEEVESVSDYRDDLEEQIHKRVFGQEQLIEHLMIAIFSRGHSLLVGVPGLAKTTLVRTLAEATGLDFGRIQFTPDLMPADITGTDILEEDPETGRRFLKFRKGPVFTNLLLADEINRTPPKTQAALLQAMQEYEVSAGNETYPLERPFLVLATQNPIEQEGTYPLPEAQQDRFMFFLEIDYPETDQEIRIVRETTTSTEESVEQVIDGTRIQKIQNLVNRVPVSEDVAEYAVQLVRATRPGTRHSSDLVDQYVEWGAGPRAGQYLVLGGKAKALLDGRMAVNRRDIEDLLHPVLRHRIRPNFHAEAEGITASEIVHHIRGLD